MFWKNVNVLNLAPMGPGTQKKSGDECKRERSQGTEFMSRSNYAQCPYVYDAILLITKAIDYTAINSRTSVLLQTIFITVHGPFKT